jgi:hypothetical protein
VNDSTISHREKEAKSRKTPTELFLEVELDFLPRLKAGEEVNRLLVQLIFVIPTR